MREKFNFKDLFVLDLANNHQGSVPHGKSIIDYCADLALEYGIKVAIKFQFRDLPTFVHVSHRENSENKHVPRFLSTMLTWDQFDELKAHAKNRGLLTICTPFDEESVDRIVGMGFDLIKIASCSATDWPLIEKAATTDLPLIASTGGQDLHNVDNLVSFLRHRAVDFALMHCVSIYPTPDINCNLTDIREFKERYPEIVVGWSTHESPFDTIHVGLALALGSQMFERHVGLETEQIELNKYSSGPKELDAWFSAYLRSKTILGSQGRINIAIEEREAISGLERGVYLARDITEGEQITRRDVYFAFPRAPRGLSSGAFKEGLVADQAIEKDDSLPDTVGLLDEPAKNAEKVLKHAIHDVKAMLAKAKIELGHDFKTEYSHHEGILNFRKVGTVLIEVVNRSYAKKILVQLPGQSHPLHMHKLKEETFVVLSGGIDLTMDRRTYSLKPGDKITVLPGVWHEFNSAEGCILEEISTTAISGDSVYRDPKINIMGAKERKTVVDHWGRFQITEQLITRDVS